MNTNQKKKFSSTIALLLLSLVALNLYSCKKNKSDSCNGEGVRRDIKIVTDADSSAIDQNPIAITVTAIGELSVGEVDSDSPRQAVEKKVYTVTAKVHKLSKHRDGDWKVKLTDGDEKYLNCESPNPGCEFATSSNYYGEFLSVREWLVANEDDLVGKTVTIIGIGFIDIDHKYPRNAADNEMELHPILDIHF